MNWNEDFSVAKILLSKGLVHAANSLFLQLKTRITEQSNKNKIGELYDQIGIVYLSKFPNYKKALEYFSNAIESTDDRDARVKYTIHLSMAYGKMSEFDTCYRYLMGLADDLNGLSNQTKRMLFTNLSVIQGINGFYKESITNIERSLGILSDKTSTLNQIAWNNNKGLAYLEMGKYDKAEKHLKQAVELGGKDFMQPLSELGRLCLLQNKLAESLRYAERALDGVWSSIINYDKEEVARLCNLLAYISIKVGQVDLAIRLEEKAQVLFGQLGMWRQWQNAESQLEQWSVEPPKPTLGKDYSAVSMHRIHHFLQCLEALNLQELGSKEISDLLDIRGYYVQRFSAELGLSGNDANDLILTSRFADYGLTALESEVVMNPTRSEIAFEQYKQHPSLGVKMAKALNLSDSIADVIIDHHENYDGSGYPNGKKGDEINYLARVFSVVDRYANGIVFDDMSHFEVVNEIIMKRGTVFDPVLVDSFARMHDIK